ncbi:MAG: response regulator [Pseudomonadota bacterium]
MTDDGAHILVVDDDLRLRELLQRFLQSKGHRVTTASDAGAAHNVMSVLEFDLIVCDIMMPGESGLDFLVSLRATKDTPLILLTARGDPADRIEGLRRGADDYLPKPFEPEELALRVDAILRRRGPQDPPEEFRLSGLVFNAARGELRDGDRRIRLTEAELQLLTALSRFVGEPVSRDDLASMTTAGLERSVDVQVTRLRRKIEPDPKEPIHIQTVRGIGYRFLPD